MGWWQEAHLGPLRPGFHIDCQHSQRPQGVEHNSVSQLQFLLVLLQQMRSGVLLLGGTQQHRGGRLITLLVLHLLLQREAPLAVRPQHVGCHLHDTQLLQWVAVGGRQYLS